MKHRPLDLAETRKIEETARPADQDRQAAVICRRSARLQRDLLTLAELMALLAWNA